jgi:riboflavin kinase/FMN adenylyltransferase
VKAAPHASELETGGRKVSVAIGMFDGAHLGHQQVFAQTICDARAAGGLAVAVTFDKHPASILAPEKAPLLIYPLRQKLAVIESLGLDAAWVIQFDQNFSKQTAEVFIDRMAADFGKLESITVGANFTFGHRRTGNVALLQELGKRHGFRVNAAPAALRNGQPISSTRIRERIAAGDFAEASAMLGRPYSISGEVAHGDQLGRKIGFPTANIEVAGLAIPPFGVYQAHASARGERWPAVVNLGLRPTAGKHLAPRLEAHILRGEHELYGEVLDIEFAHFLRSEKKFASIEELKEQIKKDAAMALKLHGL